MQVCFLSGYVMAKPIELTNKPLKRLDAKMEKQKSLITKCVSVDHHVYPWMLLEIQGNLNNPPNEKETTVLISSKLWSWSYR
eukprot:UN05029